MTGTGLETKPFPGGGGDDDDNGLIYSIVDLTLQLCYTISITCDCVL